MSGPMKAAQCEGCRQPVAGKHKNIIGIQAPGQPETKHVFCTHCAKIIASNVVRREREQSRKGVLTA
jgi:RNase P subunit RPR2